MELKPCRFCGSNDLSDCYVYVLCKNCGARGPFTNGGKFDDHADYIDHMRAVESWNARADLDKEVADERGKWEKIIDIVIENKYEPDKWPEEVRDRMPMTLREAIRNRGKKC